MLRIIWVFFVSKTGRHFFFFFLALAFKLTLNANFIGHELWQKQEKHTFWKGIAPKYSLLPSLYWKVLQVPFWSRTFICRFKFIMLLLSIKRTIFLENVLNNTTSVDTKRQLLLKYFQDCLLSTSRKFDLLLHIKVISIYLYILLINFTQEH